MPVALIVGGTGQIGRAVARELIPRGWTVRLAQRTAGGAPPDLAGKVEMLALDREDDAGLEGALAGGVDALIDCMAFTETHARQLLAVQEDVGAFVVISSASVYRDDRGRTLDEAAQTGFPDFPVPIGEDQPTVAPGPQTYSTAKVALERTLLRHARRPVSLLRAGAVYGDGSRHPREWWFVKRILDGRRRIPLAYRGESRFHPAATANIAALVNACLAVPGARVLNAVDADAPTVASMGRAIAAAYGVDIELALLDGPPVNGVGGHPWCIPKPIVLDMSRATALGYRPAADYAGAVGEACRSAEAAAQAGAVLPAYIEAMFDYAAEDAALDVGDRAPVRHP